MVTVRCTQKLLKRLKLPPSGAAPQSSTRLGDWYANLIRVNGEQLILCVSAKTLLPVIVTAKDAHRFPERLAESLGEVLRGLQIPEKAIAEELAAMGEQVFAKTASRQILGSMTDFELCFAHGRIRAESLVDASLVLARAPCSPLEMISPDRATIALFGGPARSDRRVTVPPPELARAASAPPPPEAVQSIRRVHLLTAAAIDQLTDLLVDCVEGGASVSFLHPLSRARALTFWKNVAYDLSGGERAVLIAEDHQGICGSVQLVLSQPQNQPHRADLVKLLVHRRARRRGLGAALVREAESVA